MTNELQKKPCSHYLSGYCQFGALCRFSHFTREELDRLQQTGILIKDILYNKYSLFLCSNLVQEKEQREWLKQQPKTYTTDDISFFLKRRNAKQKELIYKHFLDTFNYGEMNANEIKTLPPSLQPPVNDNFKEDIVLAEWGE